MIGSFNDAMADIEPLRTLLFFIGTGVLIAVVVRTGHFLLEAFNYPPMLPLTVGGCGFWWLLITARPEWAAVSMAAGMAGAGLLQAVPRRKP